MSSFPIVEVTLVSELSGAGLAVKGNEDVGSKEKTWCVRVDSGERYLLKYARPNTGEDWAEKVAAELAGPAWLGLPHAEVELARCNDRSAIWSRDFLSSGERLVHGNEILFEDDPAYPRERLRRVPQHTLKTVFAAFEKRGVRCPVGFHLPDGVTTAADLFSGYLVLDALIGNTDRHHENWAVVLDRPEGGDREITLAPTYDHGSSLGRELRDEERERRLAGKDRRATLAAYADRGVSAFYDLPSDSKPLAPRELLRSSMRLCAPAVRSWVRRLQAARRSADFASIVDRIPTDRMSDAAKRFAIALMEYNLEKVEEVVQNP